jgi:hypothetical protein
MRSAAESPPGNKIVRTIGLMLCNSIHVALIVGCIALARAFGLSYGWSLLIGVIAGHVGFVPSLRLIIRATRYLSRARAA